MPDLPAMPTDAQIRNRCRGVYGHFSNISRQYLKLLMAGGSPDDLAPGWDTSRVRGLDSKVTRTMAEVFESEWATWTLAQQDALLDWYIPLYLNRAPVQIPENRYAMMGHIIGRIRMGTCDCEFMVASSESKDDNSLAEPDIALSTGKIGVEHKTQHDAKAAADGPDAARQGLYDAVRNENLRLGRSVNVVANELGLSPDEAGAAVVHSFSDVRMADGIARQLSVVVTAASPAQRTQVQNILDAQFGPNEILVTR